jgi:hypothetical protein
VPKAHHTRLLRDGAGHDNDIRGVIEGDIVAQPRQIHGVRFNCNEALDVRLERERNGDCAGIGADIDDAKLAFAAFSNMNVNSSRSASKSVPRKISLSWEF